MPRAFRMGMAVCTVLTWGCVSPREDCLGRGGDTEYSDAEAWCQTGAAVVAMGPLYGDTNPVGDNFLLLLTYECWRANQERQRCEKELNIPLRPDL